MLSVCVPVFNNDVRVLARQLSVQAKSTGVPTEIILADDFSTEYYRELNSETAIYPHVKYHELDKNVGRSAIRNYLARKAKYQYILFLDADSIITNKQFLKTYIDNIYNARVICGGTIYSEDEPEKNRRLRWIYGRKREQVSENKQRKKGFAITANNFLIARDTILKVPFREEIKGYGHEDTVLGYDLHQAGAPALFINNPVMHNGLEDSETYLAKTRDALENLLFISTELVPDPAFREQSGLLQTHFKLKKAGLQKPVAWLFNKSRKYLEKQLLEEIPELRIFDLYRLGYLCAISGKSKDKYKQASDDEKVT